MDKNKGLYIHIPFCKQKCKYCDFTSFCNKENMFDIYLDKLFEEAKEFKGYKTDTIFFGGGTPTLLNERQLYNLLNNIYKYFSIPTNAEISIESNPKTLTEEKLKTLKENGINRISIGVQSFCDNELKAIGRIHNSEEAIKTIEMVKNHGFDNFNLDIMLNLPFETEENLLKTLNRAVSLSPAHLSCYSLILEEGTPLYNEYKQGKYKETSDEFDRYLYHKTVNFLKEYGYEQYEISNFAKKGYQCRHNIKYWSCDEYIGLGVSAHSYLDDIRYYNTSDFNKYLSGTFHEDDKSILTYKDKISEYMIMKLRMTEGINENEFRKRFGKNIRDIYSHELDKFISLGLMKYENNSYSLTDYGIDISNSVLCEFV